MNVVVVGKHMHLQCLACPCLPIYTQLWPWTYIGHREPWARYIEA